MGKHRWYFLDIMRKDLLIGGIAKRLVQSPNRAARPLVDPRKWITENDYPSNAFRDRREGDVRYRLHFGVDGRVNRCDIIQSSGHADLDAATCKYVRRRARFEPATNGNAELVPGSLSYTYHWVVPRN